MISLMCKVSTMISVVLIIGSENIAIRRSGRRRNRLRGGVEPVKAS